MRLIEKGILALAGGITCAVALAFAFPAQSQTKTTLDDPYLSVTTGGTHYQLAATDPADAKKKADVKKVVKKKAAVRRAPAKKVVAAPAKPSPAAPAAPVPAPKASSMMDRGLDAVGRVVGKIVHAVPCAIARSDGLSPAACKG